MTFQTEAPPTGTLALSTMHDGHRTVALTQFHQGALRVLRPHYPDGPGPSGSGQALFTVVNPGGGFLGADRYTLGYRGGAGTSAMLATQSATKIYRTPQGPARQHQRFRLEAGALLEVVPDPLIAYRDAEFIQSTEVDLAPEAAFLSTEIVTPGWSPDGKDFSYRQVGLRTRLRRGGRPLLLDNLMLRPATGDPRGIGWLEGRTHVASIMAVAPGITADTVAQVREIADGIPGVHAGASLLDGPGLVLRALGNSTGSLTELARSVGTLLRREVWPGRTPAGPWELRKY
jgi:urease accessory protein